MLLGSLMGIEREAADKPASLQTHILVAGAPTLFVALGLIIVGEFSGRYPEEIIKSDLVRDLQATMSGASFLGVGTIFRQRSKGAVEGLTTAASVFLACGIGITVALEQWILAAGVTIFSLIVLGGLPFQQKRRKY